MNFVDASLLALVALSDLALFAHLRYRRRKERRVTRMYRSLTRVVRRELALMNQDRAQQPSLIA